MPVFSALYMAPNELRVLVEEYGLHSALVGATAIVIRSLLRRHARQRTGE
jgi:hypothetical protein